MPKNFITFSFLLLLFFMLFILSSRAIDVSCKGGALIDADSGELVFGKNEDLRLPMASTTKIMTALVTIENSCLDDVVRIIPCMTGIEGSSIYLQEGEELTVSELLYALMLESANDASVALAYHVGGSIDGFVDMMNQRAKSLGLASTHFTNPHGLDNEEHYTTAFELATIAREAMKNPVFSEIVSTYKRTIPLNCGEGTRVLINHNKLLRSYEGAIGVKTGFTKKCGRCLVSCAEVDGVKLICVTLNAPNDWNDHKNMLDYGFELYERVNLASSYDYKISLNVVNGEKATVLATNHEPLSVTLKKDNRSITAVCEANRLLSAPIRKGDMVGRIAFYCDNEEIGYVSLFACENVKDIKYKKSLFERLFG